MAYQVIGIGNAVMDVISTAADAQLDRLGVQKGIMQLIERDRAEVLTHASNGARLIPGGSVANTLAGLGRLGLSTAFIGRVAEDDLGRDYARDMASDGTDFVNAPVAGAALPTSRSIIYVTPDGERSMNTYLGVSGDLDRSDVDPTLFSDGTWLFLEGYLFDKDEGKAAFLKAAEACHAAGGKAGIALSDPFCVDRHRDDFRRPAREQRIRDLLPQFPGGVERPVRRRIVTYDGGGGEISPTPPSYVNGCTGGSRRLTRPSS